MSRRRGRGEGNGEGSLRKSTRDIEFNLIDTELGESNAEILRPSKPISARKAKVTILGANVCSIVQI